MDAEAKCFGESSSFGFDPFGEEVDAMNHDDNWLNDVAAMQILGPRERQEDSALHVRLGRGRLIVVADGMGGEPAGDMASMAAVLGFEKGFGAPADGFENNMAWAARFMDGLRGALDAMNAAVEAGHGRDGMATTLAAVWVDPDGIRWINVGDSGAYGSRSSYRTHTPARLTKRHGEGNWVQSGLIAGDGDTSYDRTNRARFCASDIDFHPGIFEVSTGSMVIVASDGIDVLADNYGRHWQAKPYEGPDDAKEQGRMWENLFLHRNPRQFLRAAEDALADGTAKDNTTAIAIRTSVESLLKYGESYKDYEPLTEAPDREVLGPELPVTGG